LARDLDRRLDAYARKHHAGDHTAAAEAVLAGALRWLSRQSRRRGGRPSTPRFVTAGRPRPDRTRRSRRAAARR
jgi:hypothetical protein